MVKNSLIKSVGLVALFTLISKSLGLFRELSVAYVFGASYISDAYILGTMISQIVYMGIANAMFTSYIPIASKTQKKPLKINYLTSNIINITLLILLVVSIILTFNSVNIVNLISGNSSQEVKEITNFFFKMVTIPSSFLIVSYFFMGYLHIHSRFVANIIFSIPMNICIIVGVFLGSISYKVFAIMFGIGMILPAIILYLYSVYKEKYKHSLSFDFKESSGKEIFILFTPIFLGGIISQTAEIADKMFAASLGEGIVSAMYYGKMLQITIVSILAISVGQVIFPYLSKIGDMEDGTEKINKYISKVLKFLLIIILPITLTVIIFSETIVKMVLMHGAFNENALTVTAMAFLLYCLAIPAVSISEIIFRAFYSLKKSIQPTLIFSGCMGLNVILDYICIKVLDLNYKSLVLTTTFVEWLSMIICMLVLKKYIGRFDLSIKDISIIILPNIILLLLIITIKYYLVEKLQLNDLLTFLIAGLIGIGVYAFMIIKLRLLNISIIKERVE